MSTESVRLIWDGDRWKPIAYTQAISHTFWHFLTQAAVSESQRHLDKMSTGSRAAANTCFAIFSLGVSAATGVFPHDVATVATLQWRWWPWRTWSRQTRMLQRPPRLVTLPGTTVTCCSSLSPSRGKHGPPGGDIVHYSLRWVRATRIVSQQPLNHGNRWYDQRQRTSRCLPTSGVIVLVAYLSPWLHWQLALFSGFSCTRPPFRPL